MLNVTEMVRVPFLVKCQFCFALIFDRGPQEGMLKFTRNAQFYVFSTNVAIYTNRFDRAGFVIY